MSGQCFAQLSDPHLTTLEGVAVGDLLGKRGLGYLSWRRRRRFEHRPQVLDALLQDLSTFPAEQVLVTGDLTHVGLPEEFRQAAGWLERLGEPHRVAVIPGNHDACVAVAPERGLHQWRGYLASDQGDAVAFPSLRIRGDIAFIGLSTACPTPPLMASGTLGDAQLEALARLLIEQRERFRVVYLHHSPIAGAEKWRKRLTDAAALRSVISEAGAELILHGHGHRARWESLAGPRGDLPVLAVPSASALGLHGADVAAYNRYAVSANGAGWQLQVNTRRYDRQGERFVAGESRQYVIAR